MGINTIDHFREYYGVIIPRDLIEEAFTHPSYKNIDPNAQTNSQLETLGDAVLDLIITEVLIRENSDISSGELTFNRSVLVNNSSLSEVGRNLNIDQLIRADKDYELSEKDIANATEALFGAIYMNSGLNACIAFYNQIKHNLTRIADRFNNNRIFYNPIGELNEFTQSRGIEFPVYRLIKREGLDHDPFFVYEVKLTVEGTEFVEQGSGSSKKKAKIAAAAIMLNNLTNIGLINT